MYINRNQDIEKKELEKLNTFKHDDILVLSKYAIRKERFIGSNLADLLYQMWDEGAMIAYVSN